MYYSAVIDKITHRANRIQWGIANSFISFDEAVFHAILYHDIYKIYLFDESNDHFLI